MQLPKEMSNKPTRNWYAVNSQLCHEKPVNGLIIGTKCASGWLYQEDWLAGELAKYALEVQSKGTYKYVIKHGDVKVSSWDNKEAAIHALNYLRGDELERWVKS